MVSYPHEDASVSLYFNWLVVLITSVVWNDNLYFLRRKDYVFIQWELENTWRTSERIVEWEEVGTRNVCERFKGSSL